MALHGPLLALVRGWGDCNRRGDRVFWHGRVGHQRVQLRVVLGSGVDRSVSLGGAGSVEDQLLIRVLPLVHEWLYTALGVIGASHLHAVLLQELLLEGVLVQSVLHISKETVPVLLLVNDTDGVVLGLHPLLREELLPSVVCNGLVVPGLRHRRMHPCLERARRHVVRVRPLQPYVVVGSLSSDPRVEVRRLVLIFLCTRLGVTVSNGLPEVPHLPLPPSTPSLFLPADEHLQKALLVHSQVLAEGSHDPLELHDLRQFLVLRGRGGGASCPGCLLGRGGGGEGLLALELGEELADQAGGRLEAGRREGDGQGGHFAHYRLELVVLYSQHWLDYFEFFMSSLALWLYTVTAILYNSVLAGGVVLLVTEQDVVEQGTVTGQESASQLQALPVPVL